MFPNLVYVSDKTIFWWTWNVIPGICHLNEAPALVPDEVINYIKVPVEWNKYYC